MNCSTEKSGSVRRCIKIGMIAVAGVAVVTAVVMCLWNALLPDIFAGVSPIGYWQALGLLVLSRILFGGLRGCGHRRWRERRQQWESMSPEERARLKGRFGSRWAGCCSPAKAEAKLENPANGNAPDQPANMP